MNEHAYVMSIKYNNGVTVCKSKPCLKHPRSPVTPKLYNNHDQIILFILMSQKTVNVAPPQLFAHQHQKATQALILILCNRKNVRVTFSHTVTTITQVFKLCH